jgi:opacity protein-like surface antigen
MKLWKSMLLVSAGLAASSNLAFADEIQSEQVQEVTVQEVVVEEVAAPVVAAPVTKAPKFKPAKKQKVKNKYPFEIIAMGGIATLDAEDAYVDVTEYESDRLEQTNENDWDAWTVNLGLAYNQALTDNKNTDEWIWFPQISPQLNLYYLAGDIEGEVYRFDSPDWNQESYEMDFASTRLMLDLALTIGSYKHFSIYGIAGIGLSWNSVDFEASAHEGLDCPINPLGLESEDSTSFAYEVGAGMSYEIIKPVTLSLQYLYTGILDVKVGGPHDFETERESEMDLSSQSVMLGLRIAI